MNPVAKSPRNWDRVQFPHVDSLIPLARWKKRNWIDLPWRLKLRLLLPIRVYKRRGIVMMLIVMDPLRRLQEFSSAVAHGGMWTSWQRESHGRSGKEAACCKSLTTGCPVCLGWNQFCMCPHKFFFSNLHVCASTIFTENSGIYFVYYTLSHFWILTKFD